MKKYTVNDVTKKMKLDLPVGYYVDLKNLDQKLFFDENKVDTSVHDIILCAINYFLSKEDTEKVGIIRKWNK